MQTSPPDISLRLRPLDLRDVELVYRLRSDAENHPYSGRKPYRYRREAVDFVRAVLHEMEIGAAYYYMIEHRGTCVGTICLWNIAWDTATAEVGYEILPEHRRRGLATRALREVIERGTALGLRRLEAYAHVRNLPSVRMLEREGFYRSPHDDNDDDRPEGFVRWVRSVAVIG